jgi:hypothetical protein
MNRSPATWSILAALTVGFVTPAVAAEPPQILDPQTFVNIYRLPDGTMRRVRAGGGFIHSQTSADNGLTWGPTQQVTPAPGSTNPVPVLDDRGEMHFFRFLLDDQTNGERRQPNVNYFLDIWHVQSTNQQTAWAPIVKIHDGYTGSIMNAIQTRTGRLFVPFGNWIPGGRVTDPFGRNYTTAVYSDDYGQTWTRSASQLYSPVPPNYNGNGEGAVEPAVIQLNDGRLWMVMRTQAGTLYESYSQDDGTTWSEAAPSIFYASTGPPNMTRLDDGRIVLLWNQAEMPARVDGKVWYAGRDTLHAAVSADDGQTWSGFREIYRDPFRNGSPEGGDSGTAYPFVAPTHDGHVLAISGQAQARAMLRIDPDWLEETAATTDFTGPDPLAEWSVFKSFGPVESVKRDRVQGAQVIAAEVDGVATPVLHIRRPDDKDPDGATWNFPMAKAGTTQARLMITATFDGGSIGLADQFFQPTDEQGEARSIFRLDIAPDGTLSSGGALTPGTWHDLTLDWDLAQHTARVLVDGAEVGTLAQRHAARPGPNYLRLRSAADALDPGGMLLASASQEGRATGPVRESTRLNADDAGAALDTAAPWTHVRFDDYVPNNNGGASGNGVTGTFAGNFTGFVDPLTAATPVGLIVSTSAGVVTFSDNTSNAVTSDLLGPTNGGTLTLTFVNPDNPTQKATVDAVAFRFGSTLADNVRVTLLDVDGVELPDYLFAALDASTAGGVTGFHAYEDLKRASAIHQIVFEGIGSDTWVLGSFATDAAAPDLAFTGFRVQRLVIPEPGLSALAALIPAFARPARPHATTP